MLSWLRSKSASLRMVDMMLKASEVGTPGEYSMPLVRCYRLEMTVQ